MMMVMVRQREAQELRSQQQSGHHVVAEERCCGNQHPGCLTILYTCCAIATGPKCLVLCAVAPRCVFVCLKSSVCSSMLPSAPPLDATGCDALLLLWLLLIRSQKLQLSFLALE